MNSILCETCRNVAKDCYCPPNEVCNDYINNETDWPGRPAVNWEEPKEKTGTAYDVILDSGNRREFENGFVRDMGQGKGRCDLMPMSALLDLAKHCEAGAIKYGERNIDKGAPQSCLIDSALRHIFKYMRGDKDENHLLAALWNIAWAVNQEHEHKEMMDIPSRLK